MQVWESPDQASVNPYFDAQGNQQGMSEKH